MSSYQRQSSGYQNIPSIQNDHDEDNDNNNNHYHDTTSSSSSSFSGPSPSSFPTNNNDNGTTSFLRDQLSELQQQQQQRNNNNNDGFSIDIGGGNRVELGKRQPLYICLIIAFFVIIEGFTGHGNNKKTSAINVTTTTTTTTNAAPEDVIVNGVDTNNANAVSSSSSEVVVQDNETNEELKEEDKAASSSSSSSSSSSKKEEGRLAYLLSYPNSGTTYTTTLVSAMANRSNKSSSGAPAVASNYRVSCAKDDDGRVFSAFDNGPCYLSGPADSSSSSQQQSNNLRGAEEEGTNQKEKVPTVLTVTHCGGRCPYASINCPPQDYIETYLSFEQQCRTVASSSSSPLTLDVTSSTSTSTKEGISIYPSDTVSKAVHLYRNPLDNIVSRFHAARYEHRLKIQNSNDNNNKDHNESKEWMKTHTNSPKGFKAWCEGNDVMYVQEEMSSKYFPEIITLSSSSKIPCRDEFFRWIQFHNLAHEVVEYKSLESIVVHYQEFGDDLINVYRRLGNFLGYDDTEKLSKGEKVETLVEDELPRFVYGNTYEEYYTEEETEAIWEFMERMSHPFVWETLQFYRSEGSK